MKIDINQSKTESRRFKDRRNRRIEERRGYWGEGEKGREGKRRGRERFKTLSQQKYNEEMGGVTLILTETIVN